jgi:hypothetical protein
MLLLPSLMTYRTYRAKIWRTIPGTVSIERPRIPPLPPPRQDDQINLIILIILIIFVKQRTYLTPHPSARSPNLKKDLKLSNFKNA